ncbi:hypothetical protein F2P81_011193 [Scophthalmus maximus]|uniref:Uncharacterized protein n=1 Tax=Scophthalmus maximus TaxID=52904 RepID=A0A6A4SXW4_SCOMX|nr:hypothetical protein F2P81_011193 [Scophthalmus maximus]
MFEGLLNKTLWMCRETRRNRPGSSRIAFEWRSSKLPIFVYFWHRARSVSESSSSSRCVCAASALRLRCVCAAAALPVCEEKEWKADFNRPATLNNGANQSPGSGLINGGVQRSGVDQWRSGLLAAPARLVRPLLCDLFSGPSGGIGFFFLSKLDHGLRFDPESEQGRRPTAIKVLRRIDSGTE